MKHYMKISLRSFLLILILMFSVSLSASAAPLKDVRKAPEVTGSWVKSGKNYKFRLSSGKYAKTGWIRFEENIYYINKKGFRASGWVTYNKHHYYLNKSGKMVTGWLNKKYYLQANGQRASGPLKIDGDTYFFDTKNGKMKTGWVTYKKKKYYFNKSTGKKMTSTWIKDNKNWKYVNDKGVMQKSCWLVLGSNKYYVNSSGNRVTGEQYINGKWYYFKSNGVYDPSHKININVDPKKKMVALTFDDGPGPYTSSLLNCLRDNKARATFFMVGSSVHSYTSTIKKMVTLHCELGNHSYSHADLASLSTSGISSEISRTNKAIKSACGKSPTVCRLPYGSGHNNSRVLNALNLPSIYWSIDTLDWANTGNPSHTVNAVLNQVHNGDIVLMHDIHSSTVTAAKTIIPALRKRGYQMVTVSELAKYKGKRALKAGKTYYSFR